MKYLIVYPENASNYLSCTAANLAEKLCKDGFEATCTASLPEETLKNTAIVKLVVKRGSDAVTFEKVGRDYTLCAPTEALCAAFTKELFAAIKTKKLPRRYDVKPFVRNGWGLALPAYDGGVLSDGIYDCGSGLHNFRNMPCSDESFMQIIAETSLDEFNSYVKKLEKCGFVQEYFKTYESNGYGDCVYCAYFDGYHRVYTYYSAPEKEVRVIEDRASCAHGEFIYKDPSLDNTEATVYSYGIKLHPRGACRGEPGGDDQHVNCGQLWVVKQADNSLIVIDGGHDLQATDEAVEGFWKFLHDITGKGYDEVINIACWMCTHPHGDHFVIPMVIGRMYPNLVNFERAMYNFPSGRVVNQTINDGMVRLLEEQYPEIKLMKCHAGQEIFLGGVKIDVLTVHEDAVNPENCQSTVKRGNDMNTVYKFTMPNGIRIMVLGDFTAPREPHLIAAYAKSILECEVTQIAHHGFNSLPNIYNSISAEYAVWTQHDFRRFDYRRRAIQMIAYVQAEQAGARMHFFGDKTVIITCKPDKKVSFKRVEAIF